MKEKITEWVRFVDLEEKEQQEIIGGLKAGKFKKTKRVTQFARNR